MSVSDAKNAVNFALIEGAAKNDRDKVMLALEMHADVDCRYKGFTALYLAAMAGHAKIVGLLLRHGARTDVICNKRRSAIMIAASRGRYKVVEQLLEYHANVHLKDDRGATARLLALRNGYHHTAALLEAAEAATLPRATLLLHKLRLSTY